MTFKDKLKRFKEGNVTKEERKYIEKELEKYESIEEYYSEEISNQLFDEELLNETVESEKNEIKDIQKVVNRRLGRVVLTSVLIVVLLYVGIFYGISKVVDYFYYDPTATTQRQKNITPPTDFYFDMEAYTSLNMPGYSISSQTSQTSTGFGTYDVAYSFSDLFNNTVQHHFIDISRGRLNHGYDGIFSIQNQMFDPRVFEKIHSPFPNNSSEEAIDLREEALDRNNETTLNYLEQLNNLSYISMNITFNEDLTMEEFHTMREKYPDLDFKWVGVRTTEPGTLWSDEASMYLIGFNPSINGDNSSSRRPNPELYPYFNLEDVKKESSISVEEFPKVYETHFQSRLSYLNNREKFVEVFEFDPDKIDFYTNALNYIENNGINTYGVLVYATAEDFLENINKLPYDTLYINDVLPTAPNIYTQ
ncbi:anti sigma factor C-terminal domain-containing protein [Carnobacteriaceae bacterium 52-44]